MTSDGVKLSEICIGESSTASYRILQHLLDSNKIVMDAVASAHEMISRSAVVPDRGDHCSSSKKKSLHSTTQKRKNQEQKSVNSDMECRKRHIALEIWYDGRNYTGLAENVGTDADRSVERALFVALQRARLVQDRSSCSYSRSGRTDKGVSAAGQVVALQLKSAFAMPASLTEPPHQQPIANQDLPQNSSDKLTIWTPNIKKPGEAWKRKEMAEYPYDKILNNLLPSDIRVLGWTPVSDQFSARFSTIMRTYRYFFVPNGMNMSRMQDALVRMVGTHDFRNLCKINVDEVSNFTRTIYKAEIAQCGSVQYFLIQGNAFLWHQIRCMVAILFLVGQGLEEPSVVDELLNVEQHPGKPSYEIADEAPLVLHDCEYKQVAISYAVPNLWTVGASHCQQRQRFLIAAAQIESCQEKLKAKMIDTDDLYCFYEAKLARRLQKHPLQNIDTAKADKPLVRTMSWGDALEWLAKFGFTPEQAFDLAHIPIAQRSTGTTYEEKVASRLVNSSSQRHQRFVNNRNKKQKISQADDDAFHMSMRNGK
jgi:tRNA pseudouridine38/39 synthase